MCRYTFINLVKWNITMKFSFLLCILLILVKANADMDKFRPKTIRIYQFKGTCPGLENATIRCFDIQLVNVNRTFHVSMKVRISKPVKNGMKLRLFLSRCKSRDALDSCEVYNTIKVNHFCNILNAERKPWTGFINLFKPPVTCPLRKGTYEVKDGTFDGSALSHFPVLDWYWKVSANLLDELTGEILMCITLEGQIAPI